MNRISISILNIFVLCINLAAQEIPIGTWRLHLSYNKIINVAVSTQNVYAATTLGVLAFNKSDRSLTTYNKLNGLSGGTITCLAYDNAFEKLLIAYDDGNLDIITNDNEVTNFTRLRDLSNITGSKRINHILIQNNLAYLATDFGVVVFDTRAQEVKETWRDLGRLGASLKIYKTQLLQNTIVAATDKGVIIGSLTNNLLDFSKWTRYDAGDLSGAVQSIAVSNNQVYAVVNAKGLYKLQDNAFVKESIFQDISFSFLESASTNLLIGTQNQLWAVNANNQPIQIVDNKITQPLFAVRETSGVYWIGDSNNGLVSNVEGGFTNYLPNGPNIDTATKLKSVNNNIFALGESFNSNGQPSENLQPLNYFENGLWKLKESNIADVTDIIPSYNGIYTSSFGDGLLEEIQTGTTLYNQNNSPLQNINPVGNNVFISAIQPSASGLWVANYGANTPLLLLKNDKTWKQYTTNFSFGRYINDFIVDGGEDLWMIINPTQGGGLIYLKSSSGENFYISDATGDGALPNRSVRSIALDHDGNVWVGTDAGVGYFYAYTQDIVKPIFENRFLLRDEKITAIEVDGGNRKWMGTERGVWLFSPTGESLVYNFTTQNSPLVSNVIRDIEINKETGEVFFATDKGIVSFRGDATDGNENSKSIKIFPNPVTSAFSGQVGITGLVSNAIVKITDVSGKLIWQTEANGGTATWNVRDNNGRRARAGVYLVFAATQEGGDTVVGKIAVVD